MVRYASLLARGLALAAVAILTAVFVDLVQRPDSTRSRLAFAAVVVGVAWLGAASVLTRRWALSFAGGFGLFLLGFWQAALWMYVIPPAGFLVLVAAMDLEGRVPGTA